MAARQGTPGRWPEALGVLIAACVLGACAHGPGAARQSESKGAAVSAAAVAKKVQTMPELMAKLKTGLEQRRLNDPSFYERELGYPIERPQTLTQLEPANERYRKITFDEGELKDMRLDVLPATVRPRRVDMWVSGYGTTEHCMSLEQLQALWGKKNFNLPEMPTSRGSAENWTYTYRFNLEDEFLYLVQKSSRCLIGFAAYQHLRPESQ